MKSLLVSLPWADCQFPSLQIGSLASYARKKGYDVVARHLHLEVAAFFGLQEYDQIVNCREMGELLSAACYYPQKKQEIIKFLRRTFSNPNGYIERYFKAMRSCYRDIDFSRYVLIGFSSNMHQLFSSLLFAKWIKRDYPNIKIVFGGVSVSCKAGAALLRKYSQIDWCICGEGEIGFTALLGILSNKSSCYEATVPGLIYRYGKSIRVNTIKQLASLNCLPDPDYDDYFHTLANNFRIKRKKVTPFLLVEASRGCPYNCAFCCVPGQWGKYRTRDIRLVVSQMARLSRKYRTVNFYFSDNNFPIRCADAFCRSMLQSGRDYRIICETRVSATKRQVRSLRTAGMDLMQVGVETLSSGLLKKMSKMTRVIDNLQVMKFCEEAGLDIKYYFIIQYPTETQANVYETVKNMEYAMSFQPPHSVIEFKLLRGSQCSKKIDYFNISSASDSYSLYSTLVPDVFEKRYVYRGKTNKYDRLLKKCREWSSLYINSKIESRRLLSYFDCGEFIEIEDLRCGESSIVLEGDLRKLYLFCDSYKSFSEIKKRFPKWDEKEIKKVLNKLVKLKVMFREDDDYLSLAIRANGPR